jgi:hypothetical protein
VRTTLSGAPFGISASISGRTRTLADGRASISTSGVWC